jgi:hypothetical protein
MLADLMNDFLHTSSSEEHQQFTMASSIPYYTPLYTTCSRSILSGIFVTFTV